MNADLKHKNLTDAILCCFCTGYNILGYGFQEKVYENALLHEKNQKQPSVLRANKEVIRGHPRLSA